MNTAPTSTWNDIKGWLAKSSFFFKLAAIAFLGLLLLIPLGMVDGLLHERLNRQNEAVREIQQTWGQSQTLIGPILRLPYEREYKATRRELVNGRMRDITTTETDHGFIYLLPDRLSIQAGLEPLRRYRGIYETVVYNAGVQLSGAFPPPDLSGTKLTPEHIQWDQGVVTLAVSDLRGASRQLEIALGDSQLLLLPGSRLTGAASGVHAKTSGLQAWEGELPFALDLQLHGSGQFTVAPLGVETDMQVTSTWADPSFQGAFLPTGQAISAEGFQADWQVSYYGRSYPQQFIDPHTSKGGPEASTFSGSVFGVELAQLMGTYRPVERAIKYGVLFLVLVFGAFFLFELLAGLRVHTLQYTLIGGALILFYLSLLALSEFIGFGAAYAIGAAASTLLITVYSRGILRSGRATLIILGGLGGVYGFLFVTLRMQDYALLSGTLGLFLLLAVAMYVTRHLNRRDEAPAAGRFDTAAGPAA